MQVFDQSAFTFSDVMLIVAEAVLHHLDKTKLEVGEAELEAVRQWFAEVLVFEAHREQLLGSVETSAEGGVTVPLVAKIAAKVTGWWR